MKIKKYTTLSQKLKHEWQELWNESSWSHLCNTPVWFEACMDFFNYTDVTILSFYDENKLIAVIPLIKTKKLGIQLWSYPGEEYTDKSCLLVKSYSHEIMVSIANQLPHALYLSELSSEERKLFENNLPANLRTRIFQFNASLNSHVPLDDPFSMMSKKQRSKVFNKAKKSNTKLVTFKGDRKGLAHAYYIEERSQKIHKGISTFTSREHRRFFEKLLEYYGSQFVVDVLFLNTEPIAYSIGFELKQTYYAMNTAFNHEYHAIIPGKVLLYTMCLRLKDEKFADLDLLRGYTTLKKEFTSIVYPQYDLYISQSHLHSVWLEAAQYSKHKIIHTPLLYNSYCQFKRLFKSI